MNNRESTFKKKIKEWGLSKNNKKDTTMTLCSEAVGIRHREVKGVKRSSSVEEFSGDDE